MNSEVVSHVEFLEVRRRRQRVVAEVARRSRENAALWKTTATGKEPPAPTKPAVAVAVPDPAGC